jgi:hypothetical protein
VGNAAATADARGARHKHPQYSSPHWRIWLKPKSRCLITANSLVLEWMDSDTASAQLAQGDLMIALVLEDCKIGLAGLDKLTYMARVP